MPDIEINGRTIHYQDTGTGPQTIVFSHGYLMRHQMFANQIKALSSRYRIIAFDHRGHGQSGPCHTPFGMYDLVDDAARLIDALVQGPVHFAGMSTGGYVGMRLLLKRPELINRLILIDTGAGAESAASLRQYNQLLFFVRLIGIRPLLGKVLPLLFGKTFRDDPDRRAEYEDWRAYIAGLDRTAIRQFGRAIFDRDDVRGKLQALETPPQTLIIVGEDDIPTPPCVAKTLQGAIKGSTLVHVPKAGHSSPVESPEFVTEAITNFLA